MATYAQFFILGVQSGQLIEGCGDRAIIRIDGRLGQAKQELIAERECKKRNFVAWQLIRGPHLLAARPITKVVPLFY